MSKEIRLSKPFLGDRKRLSSLIERVLDSGFLVQGKHVAEFESRMAGYVGAKHAIAVSSGTAALHLALLGLGIGSGDEVIVPAYTFPATANVVVLAGAKPVLVDVALDTYNMSVSQVEAAISPKTKAIMPVHLFGNPVDMGPLMEIAGRHNLAVLEDAAGALGSTYDGRMCGTIGQIGCFSFHPRKTVTTAEGGMVVTDGDELARRVRSLRNHGIETVNEEISFTSAGFNYRMNELEAVLGIVQMEDLDRTLAENHSLAEEFTRLLSGVPGVALQKVLTDASMVRQAFVVRLIARDAHSAIQALRRTGVEANIGTYAVHLLDYYHRRYGYEGMDYPNAAELNSSAVAFPFWRGMTPEQKGQVVDAVTRVVAERGEGCTIVGGRS